MMDLLGTAVLAFALARGVRSAVGKRRETAGTSGELKFGSDAKSSQKLASQMNRRGWTEQAVREAVDSPYATRTSTNMATGNPAKVYYTKEGAYVIVDEVTKEIVQISDRLNPSAWIPDSNIIDPYIPGKEGS